MKQKYVEYQGRWIPANEAAMECNTPYIQGPLKPFISMLDGREVTSRLQYEADLRARGYVCVGNDVNYLSRKPHIPDVDPQQRKELIAAQIREMGYEGMKKALRKDIEFARWNSRKG